MLEYLDSFGMRHIAVIPTIFFCASFVYLSYPCSYAKCTGIILEDCWCVRVSIVLADYLCLAYLFFNGFNAVADAEKVYSFLSVL